MVPAMPLPETATATATAELSAVPVLALAVGKTWLGVPMAAVVEVLGPQEAKLAPHGKGFGVEARGARAARPVLDLRDRMGLPPRAHDRAPWCVVVGEGAETGRLLADWVGGVMRLKPDWLDPEPKFVDPGLREVVAGVYRLDATSLFVLDVRRLAGLRRAAA
jgi:purine-binding chemotaxis protein CheW